VECDTTLIFFAFFVWSMLENSVESPEQCERMSHVSRFLWPKSNPLFIKFSNKQPIWISISLEIHIVYSSHLHYGKRVLVDHYPFQFPPNSIEVRVVWIGFDFKINGSLTARVNLHKFSNLKNKIKTTLLFILFMEDVRLIYSNQFVWYVFFSYTTLDKLNCISNTISFVLNCF